MKSIKAFSIAFVFFVSSCKQSQIIGRWKLVDSKNGIGNLTIRSDLTFLVKGAPVSAKLDTIQGWHMEDMTGKWKLFDKKHLVLSFNTSYGQQINISLTDSIALLSKSNLILFKGVEKQNQTKYVRF